MAFFHLKLDYTFLTGSRQYKDYPFVLINNINEVFTFKETDVDDKFCINLTYIKKIPIPPKIIDDIKEFVGKEMRIHTLKGSHIDFINQHLAECLSKIYSFYDS